MIANSKEWHQERLDQFSRLSGGLSLDEMKEIADRLVAQLERSEKKGSKGGTISLPPKKYWSLRAWSFGFDPTAGGLDLEPDEPFALGSDIPGVEWVVVLQNGSSRTNG